MSRAIDRMPEPVEYREKKVIIIARSRTGTLSLYHAMRHLGYTSYHGAEVMYRGVHHMEVFEEALKAKYLGIGKPYGKAEFDKWFAEYDAIVELPSVFLEEITAAYPDAKVIYVERDVNKWYKSIMNTLGHSLKVIDQWPLKQLRWFDNYIDKFCSFHLMVHRVWWHGRALEDGEDILKKEYLQLHHDVKRIVPKEKLKSFNLEDGFGWKELCSALDEPIPAVEYPRKNTPSRFDDLQSGFLDKAVRRAIIKATTLFVVPLAATVGWVAWNKQLLRAFQK